VYKFSGLTTKSSDYHSNKDDQLTPTTPAVQNCLLFEGAIMTYQCGKM